MSMEPNLCERVHTIESRSCDCASENGGSCIIYFRSSSQLDFLSPFFLDFDRVCYCLVGYVQMKDLFTLSALHGSENRLSVDPSLVVRPRWDGCWSVSCLCAMGCGFLVRGMSSVATGQISICPT